MLDSILRLGVNAGQTEPGAGRSPGAIGDDRVVVLERIASGRESGQPRFDVIQVLRDGYVAGLHAGIQRTALAALKLEAQLAGGSRAVLRDVFEQLVRGEPQARRRVVVEERTTQLD